MTRPSVVAAVVGLGINSFVARAAAETVTIDSRTVYQTMTGWEVTGRAWEIDKVNNRFNPSWKQYGSLVMDKLVNELGINRVRLEIRSGFENPMDYWTPFVSGQMTYTAWKDHSYEKVNDNSDPSVANPAGFQFSELDYYVESRLLPIKQLVEANGEKLFVNLNYVDFNTGSQGSLSHALAPAEYAELIQVYLDHLRDKYAIKPDSLEIVLEPDNTTSWRGTQIGQGAAAAAARSTSAGYGLEIIGPSNANPANVIGYFDAMAQVPGALDRMKALSYHRYGSTDYRTLQAAAKARGMRTEMLEHIDGGVDQLIEDLTVAQASAWQKWGLASDAAGNGHFYYEANLTDPNAPKIAMDAATALLAPFFRFVRIGAKRLSVSTSAKAWTPVAFVNANGSNVLVIKTAAGAPSAEATIAGLSAGRYGVRTTDYGRVVKDLSDVTVPGEGTLTLTLPAGITTIYGKSAVMSPADAGLTSSLPEAGLVPPSSEAGATSAPDGSADVFVGSLPGVGQAEPSAIDDATVAADNGCTCTLKGSARSNPLAGVWAVVGWAFLRRRRRFVRRRESWKLLRDDAECRPRPWRQE